jgi:hypothetical protein
LTLLRSPLRLFDIQDVEGMAASIAWATCPDLQFHEREDLVAWLVSECWLLSQRYEPDRGINFSTFAGTTLRRRVVDWKRQGRDGRTVWQFKDRTYVRPLPQLVPLDDAGLDGALASWAGDPAADRDAACGGLLERGDRSRAADLEALGVRPRRRARG